MKIKEITIKKGITRKVKGDFFKSEISLTLSLSEREKEDGKAFLESYRKESRKAWLMVQKDIEQKIKEGKKEKK